MKKFEFGLEKVLKVRNIREEKAQLEFHKARQKAEELKERVDRLNHARQSVLEYVRSIRNDSSVEPSEAIQANRFLRHNRGRIESLRSDLSRQQEVVEKKREKLKDKSQDRKAMEKLKENKAEKYYKNLQREEQKRIDEMAHFQEDNNNGDAENNMEAAIG